MKVAKMILTFSKSKFFLLHHIVFIMRNKNLEGIISKYTKKKKKLENLFKIIFSVKFFNKISVDL